MDVINLSLGEPEIEPTRDLVALAIDGAAAAGVPTVAAAGNEFGRFGSGSVGSPGSAASAITRRRGRERAPSPRVDRVVLVGGADADLAATEARRRRARLDDPLVDPREARGRC